MPTFGAFVQTASNDGGQIYGLIYDVRVDDDPFVRQLIAAGDLEVRLSDPSQIRALEPLVKASLERSKVEARQRKR